MRPLMFHSKQHKVFLVKHIRKKSFHPARCPSLHDLLQLRQSLYFGLDVSTDHVNAVIVDAVGDVARVSGEARPPQLLHLSFEALAEDVIDHRIVYGRALCKHARQEADFRRDGAAVTENRPQAHDAVRRPAEDEA